MRSSLSCTSFLSFEISLSNNASTIIELEHGRKAQGSRVSWNNDCERVSKATKKIETLFYVIKTPFFEALRAEIGLHAHFGRTSCSLHFPFPKSTRPKAFCSKWRMITHSRMKRPLHRLVLLASQILSRSSSGKLQTSTISLHLNILYWTTLLDRTTDERTK
jgi:hypothetical protein